LNNGGLYCVQVTTLCQSQSTICCIDSRCALPCTEKVPCICTCLPGLVCCVSQKVKIKCCAKVKDLQGQE
jgi:hypothetical protein